MTDPAPSSLPKPTSAPAPELLFLPTTDGFPTRGALYRPAPSSDPSLAAVVIAAATGVPGISFCAAFAAYLASHGHPTLVFDYRYLGLSFPDGVDVKSSPSRIEALRSAKEVNISTHWTLDASAAIRLLHSRYCSGSQGRELVYVGNSAGLYVLPLALPERDLVSRAMGVSSFFPYHHYLPDPDDRRDGLAETLRKSHEAGFYLTTLVGSEITKKMKAKGKDRGLPPFGFDMTLGMGEEWTRWCDQPRYVATEHPSEYSSYSPRHPILSLTFTDDAICGGRALASDQLLFSLPLARSHRLLIDPQKMGKGWENGCRHVDAFREAQRQGAWEAMRRWVASGEEPTGEGVVDRKEYGGSLPAFEADRASGAAPLKAKL